MGKRHYLGGGTLSGFGTILKTKGRKGGLGTSGAALREQRRVAEKKKQREVASKIKANEKIIRKLGKEWAAEKGRTQYQKLVGAERVKTSPLAAALLVALNSENSDDDS